MGIDEVLANYNAVGIDVIEQMYGDDFLSFGGTDTTDELARRAGIDSQSQVLDVGCGLGGPAFRLAEQWGASVVGIDLVDLNIESAVRRAAERGLGAQVEFQVANALDLPFPDGSFDVVFGQDAWCHVPDKRALIAECARLVRPGGAIAFSDWLQVGPMDEPLASQARSASATTDLLDIDGYVELLAERGFGAVWTDDTSNLFLDRYREVMSHLDAIEGDLSRRFGPKVFAIVREKNGHILQAFEEGGFGGGRFVARRSA
ncbi:MAG: methyltransferase domain-containing protein [Actinomycetota bacterium]